MGEDLQNDATSRFSIIGAAQDCTATRAKKERRKSLRAIVEIVEVMIGLNMIVEYRWFEDCIKDDVDEERKKGGFYVDYMSSWKGGVDGICRTCFPEIAYRTLEMEQMNS